MGTARAAATARRMRDGGYGNGRRLRSGIGSAAGGAIAGGAGQGPGADRCRLSRGRGAASCGRNGWTVAVRNLQVRIRRPPSRPTDLELIDTERPPLTNGSFLARALWLAVDP